jgi:hypothetical protein
MLNILKNYLSQPSTYKGVFTIMASFGIVHMSGDLTNAITGVCLAIVGLINVVMNENKK